MHFYANLFLLHLSINDGTITRFDNCLRTKYLIDHLRPFGSPSLYTSNREPFEPKIYSFKSVNIMFLKT